MSLSTDLAAALEAVLTPNYGKPWDAARETLAIARNHGGVGPDDVQILLDSPAVDHRGQPIGTEVYPVVFRYGSQEHGKGRSIAKHLSNAFRDAAWTSGHEDPGGCIGCQEPDYNAVEITMEEGDTLKKEIDQVLSSCDPHRMVKLLENIRARLGE